MVTWRLIVQELLDEGRGGAEDLARRRQLVVGVVGLHHQREAVGVGPRDGGLFCNEMKGLFFLNRLIFCYVQLKGLFFFPPFSKTFLLPVDELGDGECVVGDVVELVQVLPGLAGGQLVRHNHLLQLGVIPALPAAAEAHGGHDDSVPGLQGVEAEGEEGPVV